MAAFDGVLLDIDGVLTVSWRALPGAADAVAELRAAGYRLRFLTNTTSRTRQVLSQTLERAGFSIAAAEILTAASATATYLREAHPGARCLLLSSGDVRSEFAGIDLVGPEEPADVVVIGGAGVEFSHDTLNQVFRLLREGVPLVAMHRNMYWQTGDKLTLDSGAYIAGLEQAAGARATVIGKPSRSFYDQAVAQLGVDAARTVVVGDDLEADVLGAKQAGMTGVLVRTGKYREQDLARSGIVPDAVLGSIAELPAWLRRR
jgi:HAD superfamily hydrolase (TIGR01458 family)